MKQLLKEAADLQSELVTWRRQLHQNPEVGLELPQTNAFVKAKLTEMGYAPQDCGPGITATVGSGAGPVILLRADMDALPIGEETELEFKAENGCMHACGHDFHTTMLLGAAKLLKDLESQLPGTVKFMFQPGEEVLTGAKSMLENGLLEAPKPDVAVMFHVFAGMPAPAGLFLVPEPGAFTAASDSFFINVKGKGGHGAMPESAVDPLVVSAHILLALQTIRSRELAGGDNVVVTVGQLAGGRANNVIPDTAEMRGTIRTFNPQTRALIPQRIQEIAQGIAASLRAEAQVEIQAGCPSVVVDKDVAEMARQALVSMFGSAAVPAPEQLGMTKMNGSEDFSFISEQIPSVMLALTAGGTEPEYSYPVHHPKVKFDEGVLAQGAAAYAGIALSYLQAENNKAK